ncbi:MAG: ATP synthase F1 subunit gamma [Bacteroides sp.]|nr:ATP synthase F1 subunit gamma [Bacteroides sp.]MCM1095554.1 ATP synthase F1 subunit gamma [Terasakiella sp.]
MATLRELKGRIGSVASSEKITGAMKMISSAKMHKAEAALRRLKPYRSVIEAIIGNLLTADAEFSSPLTESRTVRHITIVAIGSDDGLCGAYNVNLAKYLATAVADMRARHAGAEVRILTVGRKMLKAAARLAGAGVTVAAAEGVSAKSEGEEVKTFEAALRDDFLAGRTDAVAIVYMNYHSAGRQRPRTDMLLPLSADTFDTGAATGRPYIFEPDAHTIFATVLPMYLMAMTQEIFVENRASEQAARVMAMQSANDNAKKLLEQLRLEYNKLRQQSITTELLDIVGGQVRD